MSKSVQANLNELNNSDVYDTFATNSQVFDSLNTMKFYSTLSIVLCRRACEEELAINAGLSFSQIAELKEAQEHLSKRETDNLDEMERQIPYSVIPIQNLVKCNWNPDFYTLNTSKTMQNNAVFRYIYKRYIL